MLLKVKSAYVINPFRIYPKGVFAFIELTGELVDEGKCFFV